MNIEDSFLNFNNYFLFIKNNYKQILLLILVPIIIYIVDKLSNFNSMKFNAPSEIIEIKNNKNKNQLKQILKNKKK
jgi:hypothetical protein